MELQTIHEYAVHSSDDTNDGEGALSCRASPPSERTRISGDQTGFSSSQASCCEVTAEGVEWDGGTTLGCGGLATMAGSPCAYDTADELDASSSPDDEDTLSCLPTKKVHLRQQHSIAVTSTALSTASSSSRSTRSRRHTLANVRQIQDLR